LWRGFGRSGSTGALVGAVEVNHGKQGDQRNHGKRMTKERSKANAKGGVECNGEVMSHVCDMKYNRESGGERSIDGRTAGVSRTLARQDLPKTKFWRLVLILLRNPSVLQRARMICGKRRRWVLDRRYHR